MAYNKQPIAAYSTDGKTLVRIIDKQIRKYKLRPGVTTIGEGAFADCEHLRYVFGTDDVTSIEPLAFDGCKNLRAIEVPTVHKIGDFAFRGCTKLLNLYIPPTIESIGIGVIAHSGVQVLSIPATISDTIGCFDDSSLLHLDVYLPEGKDWRDVKITFRPESFNDASYPFISMPNGGQQGTINGVVFEDRDDDGITAILVPNYLRSIPRLIEAINENSISFNGNGRKEILVPSSVRFMDDDAIVPHIGMPHLVLYVPESHANIFAKVKFTKVTTY